MLPKEGSTAPVSILAALLQRVDNQERLAQPLAKAAVKAPTVIGWRHSEVSKDFHSLYSLQSDVTGKVLSCPVYLVLQRKFRTSYYRQRTQYLKPIGRN